MWRVCSFGVAAFGYVRVTIHAHLHTYVDVVRVENDFSGCLVSTQGVRSPYEVQRTNGEAVFFPFIDTTVARRDRTYRVMT